MNTTKTIPNWYESPEYREANPKIDIYVNGTYWASTNWFRKVRIAQYHYRNMYTGKDIPSGVVTCHLA